LPEELQSSAVRILDYIRRRNLKRIKLRAKELRDEVRMDTHRFHSLFKWLQEHGYCQATLTKTSKRATAKLVSITIVGEVVLRKRHKLGQLDAMAKAIYRAPTRAKQMNSVQGLIVEAFDLAYSEFYYGGKSEDYQLFAGRLEERLREHLDKEIGDRISVVHDVMLVIGRVPSAALLKDAELAKERGHFLTQNHRYILNRKKRIGSKELTDHNIRWRDRIMEIKISGSESYYEFIDLIDPWKTVEREKKERSTPGLGETGRILGRDGYDPNQQWDLDIGELERRWKDADSRRWAAIDVGGARA
jgi:hypothetical protein